MKRDYYAVLGVVATATAREIRQAYRRLGRQYSPDVNLWDPHAEGLYAEISQAYRVLSDPAARAVYDKYGHQRPQEGPQDYRARGTGRLRGDSLHVPLDLSFEDAMRGLALNVEVVRLSPCETCGASGARDGSPVECCAHCGGSGVQWGAGGQVSTRRCTACGGIGERVDNPCPACRGRGVSPATARIPVTVPPGVDTGAQLRLPAEGHCGPFGGPRGDLIVSTRVSPHPFFLRKGDNLYGEVPVTISEAALGARIEVPTLEGAAFMSVPPGTQSGQVFRFRGKGAPRLNGNGRGDLYVSCRVEIPRGLNARTLELFRELERLIASDPRAELLAGRRGERSSDR